MASYAAGQDLAPAALRSAGLLERLTASGLDVHDDGDLPHQAWSPDRDHPLAQNAGQVTTSVQQLADRLYPLLARSDDIALVLGGNCTIALGIAAALWRLNAGAPGLLYIDQALAADPAAAALAAVSRLPAGPLALHLDVDVLDFTDAPLAENTDGRNTGPTLDQVTEALTAAARDQRMRVLSIGELNPTRCAGDPDALPRFVSSIARILAATAH